MSETTAESKHVVNAWVRMVNEHAFSEIPDIVSESYVLYDPTAPANQFGGPAGEIHGPDGLEQYLLAVVRAFPDHRLTIDEMVANEDVVMTEETVTATHEGELFGLPATGRKIRMKEMQKYRIVDGKIRTQVVYYNEQDVKEQLGLTFPEVLKRVPHLAWRKIR